MLEDCSGCSIGQLDRLAQRLLHPARMKVAVGADGNAQGREPDRTKAVGELVAAECGKCPKRLDPELPQALSDRRGVGLGQTGADRQGSRPEVPPGRIGPPSR